MKLKYTEKRFALDVFDWDVDVVFTNDVPAYCKLKGLCNFENVEAFCDTQANESLTRLIVSYDPEPGLVSHEAVHAVSGMFVAIGAKFEEEIFAYHVGYIVRMVFEISSERDRKK